MNKAWWAPGVLLVAGPARAALSVGATVATIPADIVELNRKGR